MLYDPKWEKKTETKADPLKLATLIAWLEKMPSDERYDYVCNGHCLLAQYFTAQGFKNVSVSGNAYWSHRLHGAYKISMAGDPTFHRIAAGKPRTFGAALERARTAL